MKTSHLFATCAIGLTVLAVAVLPDARITVVGAEEAPARSVEKQAADPSGGKPVDEARDRAKLMHNIYAATLDVMHDRYFHGERAIVPARAMEDIFSEIKRQSNVDARWISVSLRPMSIEHEPKSEFEKRAAKEIAVGKSEYESVEDGYYRRAGAISLSGGCVSCHGGFSPAPSPSPKFAGLVISVPLAESGEVESD